MKAFLSHPNYFMNLYALKKIKLLLGDGGKENWFETKGNHFVMTLYTSLWRDIGLKSSKEIRYSTLGIRVMKVEFKERSI